MLNVSVCGHNLAGVVMNDIVAEFVFDDGSTYPVRDRQLICGVQKKGRRPISIRFLRDDLDKEWVARCLIPAIAAKKND